MHHGFKIAHTHSTQRTEGSTMTLAQTRNLLEEKLSPKNISTQDIIEAEQTTIFDDLLVTDRDVSKKLILGWHKTLFGSAASNNAGTFRRDDVAPYAGKTECALWPDIENLVDWHNKHKKR